ncbi:unnamed protein product [Meganyctiphanes norvegica]|uniref:BAG family molecular chaperone regulator 1 n=1 Tax=Meganyctiphanes norvegica TaxID=48144 RepID=A0AAV2Q6Z5_MEGNR
MLHIQESSQKIIFKGRNLNDMNATLMTYGIKECAKVMVLGKQSDPEDDEMYQAVMKIEQSCSSVELNQSEVIRHVESIASLAQEGKRPSREELDKLKKELLLFNEEFMRLLERLDGLSFQDNQAPAKQKRKSLVKKIQQLMDKTDALNERILQIQ